MHNGRRFSISEADDFALVVPGRIVAAVPDDIRANEALLRTYLQRALEIGLKAMAAAGVHLDTEIVKAEFAGFASELANLERGLEKLLAEELTDEDSQLARVLRSYLAEDGRLGRMVNQLALELGDPTREGSIPGRIRKLLDANFRAADSPFQRALNIADDSSPLKRFVANQDQKLRGFYEDVAKRHEALAKSIQAQFEKVFDHIGYRAELDESEDKGTRKGGSFEDTIVEVLSAAANNKDVVERVGKEAIDGTRVKRGDVLVDVHQDGCDHQRIVLEAKAGGYTLNGKDGLLNQLTVAMNYRDAEGGIAVITRAHAGKRQRTFDRLGHNRIVVVVDPDEGDAGFLPLEVAYAVMRDAVLVQRKDEDQTEPDVDSAEATIAEILSSLNTVNSMKRNCTEAKKNVDSVRSSIEQIETAIREKLSVLRQQLGIS